MANESPIGKIESHEQVSFTETELDHIDRLLRPPRKVTAKVEWEGSAVGDDPFPKRGSTARKAGLGAASTWGHIVTVSADYSDGAEIRITLSVFGNVVEWKRSERWVERRAKRIAKFIESREPIEDALVVPDRPKPWRTQVVDELVAPANVAKNLLSFAFGLIGGALAILIERSV